MSIISSVHHALPSAHFFSVVPKARFVQIALAVAGIAALAFSGYAVFCLCSFMYLLRKERVDEIRQPVQRLLLDSERFGEKINADWKKEFSTLDEGVFSREFAGELPRMPRLVVNEEECKGSEEVMDRLEQLANGNNSTLLAMQFLLSISRWVPPITLISEGLNGIQMSAGFGDSRRMYEISSQGNTIFVRQTALFNFLREADCIGSLCLKMTGRVFLNEDRGIAFDRVEILESDS